MIAFLRGVVAELALGEVVIDVNGVGYSIQVPDSTLTVMPSIGQQVHLNTCLVVREDSMQLYGFKTGSELALFRILTSVSGIGPKIGMATLSCYAPQYVQQYIASENISALTKVPGIGKKTAQRIILELKDKIAALPSTMLADVETVGGNVNLATDAENALIALGYSNGEAGKTVRQTISDNPEITDLSQLIKLALKNLMKE